MVVISHNPHILWIAGEETLRKVVLYSHIYSVRFKTSYNTTLKSALDKLWRSLCRSQSTFLR